MGGVVVAVTDESEDDTDVVVSRVDSAGTAQWSLRYEGPAGLDDHALDVAVAGDGSIYVVVREQTLELISEGFGNKAERTVVVLAIDPAGGRRWRWARDVPPPMYNDNARMAALAVSETGHIVMIDADATSEGIAPPSFVELDRWGNEIVRADLETSVEDVLAMDLAIAPSGDVWVAGSIYGESWIARVRADATIVWEERTQPASVRATAIAAGDADEAYALFANGDAEAGDAGFELRRYEPDGTTAWTYAMQWPSGDGYPAAVVVDCDGAPIVAGEIAAVPMRSAWIGGITTAGELAWSSTLTEDRPIAPRSLARADDGTLVLGGLEGSAELGPWIARLARP